MLSAFTIYLLLFEQVEFEQVELLRGVACCCSAWRVVDFCLVPRPPSRTRKYPPRSSSLFLAHSAPSLAHSAPFFVLSARFLYLGTIPLVPRRILHSQRDPCNSSRPHCDPCPRTLGVIPLVPRLVAGWRRCLFRVGCLVEVLMLSFCWLLVEVLGIFVAVLQGSAWFLLVVGCCERCWLLFYFFVLLAFLEGYWLLLFFVLVASAREVLALFVF